MSACTYFTDLCHDLFQFEQQYGYHAGEIILHHYECSMMLTKGNREVFLAIDLMGRRFGLPTVMFRPPDPYERFSLHEAIPAVDPDYHAKQPEEAGYPMSNTQLRALLEYYAVFLHVHAEGLLEDHRRIFAAVQRYRRADAC